MKKLIFTKRINMYMIKKAEDFIGKVMCKFNKHDFQKSRKQTETSYKKKECSRCGEIKWNPR